MSDRLDTFDHPLAGRYASPEMLRLFTPGHRYSTWRRVWLALAEAERELGLPIPAAALEEMRAHLEVDDLDLERARAHERRTRHDVMAHLHAFAERAPAARPHLHLGATSCDVTDNADLVILRDALDLVERRLLAAIAILAGFAERWADLPCLGRTHLQAAQPTTVGRRACLWLQDLLLDLERLRFERGRLALRGVKGTTGTQASFLELFAGDEARVEELDRRSARALGFASTFPVTGQTYPRKVDAQLLDLLSGIAQSCTKLATDVRLLAAFSELREPLAPDQVGSSAMPYKANPMRCERVTSLGRWLITIAAYPSHTAASQWLERTLDDSAGRRMALPEAFLAADAILVLVHNVVSGLQVLPAMIRRNLDQELPFLAAEAILAAAVRAGADRQAVHERLRLHARVASREVLEEGGRNRFLDLVAADPEVPVASAGLAALLDPARFVGRAPQQVRAFLAERVRPLLEAAGATAPPPELEV